MDTPAPGIVVSVEDETGQPVSGLKKANFNIGRYGGGSVWVQLEVSQVDNSGNNHGFYKVFIHKNKIGSENYAWQSYQANTIFTVEVDTKVDRGQCLAINKCCGDDGMRREHDGDADKPR